MPPSALLQEPDIPSHSAGAAWPHRPSHWRPQHYHAQLELNLILKGRGTAAFDGQPVEVLPGDLVWMLPGTAHELVNASDDFDMWVVAFSHQVKAQVDAEVGGSLIRTLALQPGPQARIPEQARRPLSARFLDLFQRAEAGNSLSSEQVGVALAGAVALQRQYARGAEVEMPSALRSALAMVWEDPESDRKLLAKRVGVSESTLAHGFKRAYGISLTDYRNRARAVRLLRALDQGNSVTRAVFEAGFGSLAQCHRVMVGLTGHSPGALSSAEVRTELMALVRDQPREAWVRGLDSKTPPPKPARHSDARLVR